VRSVLTSSHGGYTSSSRAVTSSHGGYTSSRANTSSPTPLISSQPKGATGVLLLTEEEKRTLVQEGYPVPTRLPLSKAEEKSLKKIRRKIKNKISAQESRRKKKEYMDTLEKRVETLAHENSDYRRKVDSLEFNNQSLLAQLQQLQAMVGDIPSKVLRSMSTQTATSCLMLLVVFLAVLSVPLLSTQLTLPSLPGHQLESNPRPDTFTSPARRSRTLLTADSLWDSDVSPLACDVIQPSDGASSQQRQASLRHQNVVTSSQVNASSS